MNEIMTWTNAMTWGTVALGGAVGAWMRWGLSAWTAKHIEGVFPMGTLLCNVIGSLLLGILTGMVTAHTIAAEPWTRLVGDGLCGALTTFSTFSMETFGLFRDGHPATSIIYLASSLFLCLVAAGSGFIWAM